MLLSNTSIKFITS